MKKVHLPFDQTLREAGHAFFAGCDEAGRGPIAGPVVAASVIIDERLPHPYIDDSKKMTTIQRNLADVWIREHAIAYAIQVVDVTTIDKVNILEASRFGMMQSLDALHHAYTYIVTDAMKLPARFGPHQALIHGDAQSFTIACASILAKVHRDAIMDELDQQYPHYGFAQHKGYPTSMHRQALLTYGIIPGVHRVTFSPVRQLLAKSVSLFP